MDLAKYRNLFLEEASEHLAEMSRALLDLEKNPDQGEAIDLVFRMAHSIKGMAGSLGLDPITELSHALEDRMAIHREAGRVEGGEGVALLFRGLEGLERMVEAVRGAGEPAPGDPALLEALRAAAGAEPAPDVRAPAAPAGSPPKKA